MLNSFSNIRNQRIDYPVIAFLLLIGVITITPILQSGALLTLLWIIFFICFHNRINRKSKYLSRMWKLGLIFISICFIYYILRVSSASIMYCMQPLTFFLPVYGLIVLNNNQSKSQIKILFWGLTLLAIINIADGIRLALLNPLGVAFQSLNEDLDPTGENKFNLGGSMFVNMTIFLLNVLINIYYNINNKKERLVTVACMGIVLWFIIMCSFKASVIVFAFISILLQYIVHKGRKSRLTLFLVSLIVFIVLKIFINEIIDILINITGSERLATRLLVFSSESTTASTQGEGTLNARSNLWLVSLQSWLRNPMTFIFGIGDHHHLDFIDTESSGIGNHSDLCDVFGRYGIIGGVILLSVLKLYYDYCIRNFGNLCKREIQVFFILILLVGFTKKIISTEEAYVIILLFPLSLMYIKSFKQSKKYERKQIPT